MTNRIHKAAPDLNDVAHPHLVNIIEDVRKAAVDRIQEELATWSEPCQPAGVVASGNASVSRFRRGQWTAWVAEERYVDDGHIDDDFVVDVRDTHGEAVGSIAAVVMHNLTRYVDAMLNVLHPASEETTGADGVHLKVAIGLTLHVLDAAPAAACEASCSGSTPTHDCKVRVGVAASFEVSMPVEDAVQMARRILTAEGAPGAARP